MNRFYSTIITALLFLVLGLLIGHNTTELFNKGQQTDNTSSRSQRNLEAEHDGSGSEVASFL